MNIFPLFGNLLKNSLIHKGLNGYQQCRTTYILKRKWAPYLSKQGFKMRKLRARDYIYEYVKNTDITKHPDVKLILTEDVEGIGGKGEVVDVRPYIAHYELLPGKQAIHASPENLAKLEEDKAKGLIQQSLKYSSPWAPKTARELSKNIIGVSMNLEEKWELQPWHLRVAFRKAGFWVPEDFITMPEKKILGPDLTIEGKEFYVKITINNREEAYVRCRIHHWSTNLNDRLTPIPDHWCLPADPIFEEDSLMLNSMPQPDGRKQKVFKAKRLI